MAEIYKEYNRMRQNDFDNFLSEETLEKYHKDNEMVQHVFGQQLRSPRKKKVWRLRKMNKIKILDDLTTEERVSINLPE